MNENTLRTISKYNKGIHTASRCGIVGMALGAALMAGGIIYESANRVNISDTAKDLYQRRDRVEYALGLVNRYQSSISGLSELSTNADLAPIVKPFSLLESKKLEDIAQARTKIQQQLDRINADLFSKSAENLAKNERLTKILSRSMIYGTATVISSMLGTLLAIKIFDKKLNAMPLR